MDEGGTRGWHPFRLEATGEYDPRPTGQGVLRAIVPLRVLGPRAVRVPSRAMIDTGSPVTILNRELAEAAGIYVDGLDSGPNVTLRGLRNRPTRSAMVEMELNGVPHRWTGQICIPEDDPPMRFSILGFEGFLDNWSLMIHASARRFGVRYTGP